MFSESPYLEKDATQVKTLGPFVIRAHSDLITADLIESGLPFFGGSLKHLRKLRL